METEMTIVHSGHARPLRIYGNQSLLEIAPVLLAQERFHDGPTTFEHGSVMALWGEGSDLASLASTGQADVALNSETQALRASVAHPDLRFIFTVCEYPYRIVARRSAGIARLEDLAGKRVGTQIQSSAEYFLDAMLDSAGVARSSVTRVPFMAHTESPVSDLPQALASGRIDAMALWEPQNERSKFAVGADAIEFYDPAIYSEKFSLCATQASLNDPQMRARIVAFVRALIAATRHLRVDPQAGWQLVSRTAGLDLDTVRRSWAHVTYPGTLVTDMLDVCERLEPWIADTQGRPPRSRSELARLIDPSIVREARRD
jgi:NitT/TauT family transport system substrate-binding protein